MKSPFAILAIVFGGSVFLLQADDSLVRDSEPLSAEQELAALSVPEGFEISLFASEPMINKPINLAYDDRGRIWVSSTVEYPYAADKKRWSDPEGTRVEGSRDAIKILEDTDHDGRADKVTDFADGLNIPTGVVPWHKPEHHDGCIAWSIPNIWYFADTTGDGVADHREILFGPLGYQNDTHGMCSSFRKGVMDDWIYATHGFSNTSRLLARDGTSIDLHSGNVFRFKPDGSSVEVFTRGQVNPFGLSFDRRGNLYSADCHSAPVYQLLHGGVYPSFGKPHDGLGFAPTMIEHTHGSTGICGITYIDRGRWGNEWNDHLLIGNPVTSKINHDHVEFRGTTPVAVEQPDFVTSKDPWFRPVDLCFGGDGALYVADFYNRIIGHYEVPLTHPGRDRERGRIWRITKKQLPSEPIAGFVEASSGSALQKLVADDPFLRREAAVQLQLNPMAEAFEPLLKALTKTPKEDTHLRHILRMAIRNHLVTFPGNLQADSEFGVELIGIAPAVGSAESAALLASSPGREQHLRHIALHAQPSVLGELVGELRGQGALSVQLQRIDALQAGLDERGQLEPDAGLLNWAQQAAGELIAGKRNEWKEIPHPDQPKSQSPWTHQERECSDGQVTNFISSLRIGEGEVEQRVGILESKEFAAPESLSIWIVGHRGQPDADAHGKNYVAVIDADGQELRRAAPPRSDIGEAVRWDFESIERGKPVRLRLVDGDSGSAYAWLGVGRIEPKLIDTETFQRAIDPESLSALKPLFPFFPIPLRDQLAPYLPKASSGIAPKPHTPEERQRLEKLIASRVAFMNNSTQSDRNKGAELFQQQCAICHQIGGEGGLIGPQLDGIGTRGVERLSEDILDPNRNVDSHFYITHFKLKDGSELGGFVISERGNSIQLRDAGGVLHRIQTASVDSRDTLALSLMPSSFGQVLSEEAFRDLLGWLLEQK